MEVDGVNYLIPVDAKLARDFDIDDEALSLDRILKAIEPARRLRLVILDACRNDPFANAMKRSVNARAIGRGLAKVEPTITNTLVAFAARAGSIALDGEGRNSPFTSALLEHLATPGQDIRISFGQIRDDVMESTGQRQEPFVYGSLGGVTVSIVDRPVKATVFVPTAPQSTTEAAQAWAAAKDISNESVLEAFIKRFNDSFFSDFARTRLQEIRDKKKNVENKKPEEPSAGQTQIAAKEQTEPGRTPEQHRLQGWSEGNGTFTWWKSRTAGAHPARACVVKRSNQDFKFSTLCGLVKTTPVGEATARELARQMALPP
jgi:uncharacterized caspase-like protein